MHIIVWALLLACIAMAGYVIIWPGTSVLGIDVGGLTARAAESLLAGRLSWESREITFIGNDTEATLFFGADLGVTPDLKETVRACMRPLWRAFADRQKPSASRDREKLSASIARLASFFEVSVGMPSSTSTQATGS